MGFEVFGVGVPEMVIILVVALIFLGPERLPEAARTIGTWVREIRGLSGEAMSIWRETLEVGNEIRDSVQPASLLGTRPDTLPPPPIVPLDPSPAATNGATPAAAVPYTPPQPVAPDGVAAGALDYPAPFEGPSPPPPPVLHYPAPFENED